MAIPDGLAITGALVGLVGGVAGVATTVDYFVTKRRAAQQTLRDSEMVLRMDFHEYYRHQGVEGYQYPTATAHLVNDGKVPAKDVEVTSSTQYAELDASGRTIEPDRSGLITFALSPVHLAERNGSTVWWPDAVPTVIGPVTLTVTWRIDGTSERSEPKTFTHVYSERPFG